MDPLKSLPTINLKMKVEKHKIYVRVQKYFSFWLLFRRKYRSCRPEKSFFWWSYSLFICTPVQMFFCEICKVFKNTFFTTLLWTAASVNIKSLELNSNQVFDNMWFSLSLQSKTIWTCRLAVLYGCF